MAWPRIKNPRSSAPPGRHEHNDVQVSVTPAPEDDPELAHEHNTGVRGTRHSVVETPAPPPPPPPAGGAQDARTRYADSGADDYQPTTAFDIQETADSEPEDSGIAILPGMATTEVPDGEPAGPLPALNQPIAQAPRPVGYAERRPGTYGTGYGGNIPVTAVGAKPKRIKDLALDQRMRIWRWRVLIMMVVGVVFSLLATWPVGLTLAVLAGIVHTIYASRTVASIPTGGNPDRAQRRTRRQLAKMQRAGYHTLHARPIPDSPEVIDHLVVGPTGVYAIDSEKWHKELPIRTRNGKQLWHGPESKKPRLDHARWEAEQASQRLSAALGKQIPVRPAMAVYGPKVPWDIATIRDVDVFSGPRLSKYLKRRARMKELSRLTNDDVRKIYDTAGAVLPGIGPAGPGAAPARSATPVG
jgi:nuclease-like protein